MRACILDCYVDEPSCLGVPPFISPYSRYLFGAVRDAGAECAYMTIDDVRRSRAAGPAQREKADSRNWRTEELEKANVLLVIGGAIVPGKYLRGMPASVNEIERIADGFKGTKVLGGPLARFMFQSGGVRGRVSVLGDHFDFVARKDLDAAAFGILKEGCFEDRKRTSDEWRRWAVKGAEAVRMHQDFPQPLIAEIEMYSGCVRYFTGGCSFCIEPLYGKPEFREAEDIVAEVEVLSALGVTNFRLGAQSCFFSYMTEELGESETPTPNVDAIKRLLTGIRNASPNLRVLHLDNADPAVIAEHPEESKEIAKLIVEHCTSGNVLAFGMESADPEVIKANNLNAEPEQVMKATELINSVGSGHGPSGLPYLLPGLNFLCGLDCERKETFELNFEFLKNVLDRGLLLRRINIRQVAPVRKEFRLKYPHLFRKFKEKVRKEIDNPMLQRVVPFGTVMREVYAETIIGKVTFCRQVGTYPLLVGIPYPVELARFFDIAVTQHGQRSITGVEFPFNINTASFSAISTLPGIGKKRAATIVRRRPFKDFGELVEALGEESVAEVSNILDFA